MTEENARHSIACSNPECKIEETGRCIEGVEPADCPHYDSESENTSNESPEEISETDPTLHRTELSFAGALTLSTATTVLQCEESRVICILGPSDSGKTCLIASVYEMFQVEGNLGIEFCGSRSLLAFEKICHDARAESRRGIPHSQRTPHGEVHLYHLQLYMDDKLTKKSLLIADRAGEEYKSASDDISIVDDFSEIHRADTISVLVDGERLVDSITRHNIKSDISMMLQALKDKDGIKLKPQLAIVLTKTDVVVGSTNKSRALGDFDKICEDLAGRVKGYVSSIQTFKVAAAPKTGDLNRGDGVPSLLKYWLNSEVQKSKVLPQESLSNRHFDLLAANAEQEGQGG